MLHRAKTEELKHMNNIASCLLSELQFVWRAFGISTWRISKLKNYYSKCGLLKQSSTHASSSVASAASYPSPVFQYSGVASATAMPAVDSTNSQAPGPDANYNYFDGKVTVYGRKGKHGDFEPDQNFTPQLVAGIKQE